MTGPQYVKGLVSRWRAQGAHEPAQPDRANEHPAWVSQMVTFGRRLVGSGAKNVALDRFRTVVVRDPVGFADRVRARVAERHARLGDTARHWVSVLETEPDLLGPFDFVRAETVHTRLIAWALTPRGGAANGLGTEPLRAFLELLASWNCDLAGEALAANLAAVDVVPERSVPPFGRVDIWLTIPRVGDFAIEVKIDHFERDNQVADYRKALEKFGAGGHCATVFLTLDGAGSSDDGAVSLRFADILRAWIPVAAAGDSGEHRYLRAYLKSVATSLCDLGGPGKFDSWHWSHQARTLSFVDGVQ